MENEKLQINFAEELPKAELVIREVNTVNELPIKAPVLIALAGVIGCVFEFLSKRKSEPKQIDEKKCHILVNREDISLTLVTNEDDAYLKGTVKGQLAIYPKFKEFGINSGKVWTPIELGLFCKMNRAFFPSREENMKLVTELMNFIGTVNAKIEKSASASGDKTDNFAQTVNSNLPKAFTLTIPIFKGMPTETIEVETMAQVSGREVAFILISPAANQTMEELRNKVIDTEVDRIKELVPDIAIIEQ